MVSPKKLSFLLATCLGIALTPPAMAQSDFQNNQSNQGHATTSATTSLGLPANLTPEQKYKRDLFIFNKLKLVEDMMKQSHHVQARQILEELAMLDPNPYSSDVHGLLAESCYKLGNNPEAIQNYELALKYNKESDVTPYWNIALAYMNMSDYDHATEWAKKLLAKNPPQQLRRQAERFLNDVGQERSEQTDNSANEGDYLNHLLSTHEANRWPYEKMPIKVFIEDDRNVPGFKAEFVAIFLNSLELWSKATHDRLAFQIVQNINQADLNLVFTANADDIARKPGMAPAEQGLASIRCRNTGQMYGSIEKAKIQILTHKPASNKELSEDDVKGVCLHEIGHALGISGHSPNDSDIMHFMMSFRQLPALTKRDKQTIARLYQDYPIISQNATAAYQPTERNGNPQYNQQFTPHQSQYQPPQQQYQYQPQYQQQQQQYQQQPQQYQQQPQQYQQQPQQYQQQFQPQIYPQNQLDN